MYKETSRRLGKFKAKATFDLFAVINEFYKAGEYGDCMELTLLVQKWADRDNNRPLLAIANGMLEKIFKEIINGKNAIR